jgi:hypothetical protein
MKVVDIEFVFMDQKQREEEKVVFNVQKNILKMAQS